MSKLRNAVSARDQHILSLRAFIVVLLCIIGGLIRGWNNAPEDISIHIPPDLRTGSVRNIQDIPASNIYTFGLYIFQQLNRWPKDGSKDYFDQIHRLSCYITPGFKQDRLNNYDAKKSNFELNRRVRSVHEIPGQGYNNKRVYVESKNSWIAYLDLQVIEYLSGKKIKDSLLRYPLRVVRYDVDPECNPWGLALDGFAEDASRLELVKEGEAS